MTAVCLFLVLDNVVTAIDVVVPLLDRDVVVTIINIILVVTMRRYLRHDK